MPSIKDSEIEFKKEVLNNLLVMLFHQILNIEEKSLKTGNFKNLTLNEIHVIEAIGYERTQPMSSIAAKLDVTLGTLTTSMNNLVKKGYVFRVRSDEDRRVVLISLSEIGREAFRHHENFHRDMIEATISLLDLNEGDILVKALSKITAYFKEKT